MVVVVVDGAVVVVGGLVVVVDGLVVVVDGRVVDGFLCPRLVDASADGETGANRSCATQRMATGMTVAAAERRLRSDDGVGPSLMRIVS